MAEVYIDGEKVVFEGEPPATLGALHALLTQALAGSGRVLASVKVDGDAVTEVDPEAVLAGIVRVDVESLSQAEAVARVAANVREALAALHARAETLVNEVLRSPWSEVAGECARLAAEVGGALENLGALSPSGRLAAEAERAVQAIGRWVETVHTADAAKIALATDGELLPALRGLSDAMESGETA